MSESAKELSSKRGDIILGPTDGSVLDGRFILGIGDTRIDSVVEAGKSYIITFNSDDSEWANMSLYITPGNIRIPLKQFNSNTYIVKFTADGTETGIGISNWGSGKTLSATNYTVYEYKEPDNVLRPFIADKIFYRSQEVQKLYLGSRLVWELQPDVSEETFTLIGRHSDKPQKIPYIAIGRQDFKNFGVDPKTVTAITVNGERYDVSLVFFPISVSDAYIYIENANSLTLNGSETLTIHYRA